MASGKLEFDPEEPVISIGTLAKKVGVSVSTVRKYERQGLIIAHRTDSKHRLFSMEDLNRVRNIHQMIQERGLNIEGIRRIQALLPCWKLFPCSEDTRHQCMAFKESIRPCWMENKPNCARENKECRECLVYRLGSMCMEDIKKLLHEQDPSKDAEKIMEQAREKRRG